MGGKLIQLNNYKIMEKFLSGFAIGAILVFVFWITDIFYLNNQYNKQIEQRDSVNTHNIIVIESLEEYIRLDSLTELEELYPTK